MIIFNWNQNKVSWCISENDHNFEQNEDCVTVFLQWTDFREIITFSKSSRIFSLSILAFWFSSWIFWFSSSFSSKSARTLALCSWTYWQRYIFQVCTGSGDSNWWILDRHFFIIKWHPNQKKCFWNPEIGKFDIKHSIYIFIFIFLWSQSLNIWKIQWVLSSDFWSFAVIKTKIF